MNLIWKNHKIISDVLFSVNDAFIGRITDSMQSAFVGNKRNKEIELIITYNKKPSNIDLKLVDDVIFDILDGVGNKISKVNYISVLYSEREQIELNRYLPIFVKYDADLD